MTSSEFSSPLTPGMVDASTGERSVALATAQALVDAARRAQPAWAARGPAGRAQILARFHDRLYARRDEVAQLVTRESGKPRSESLVADVLMALEGARFLTRIADDALRPRRVRSQTWAAWRKEITTHYDPFGVVAVIAPWNYPFFFPAMHVMTALAAGNAVILKPSEHAPACGAFLVELLHESGVPHDIVSVLQGEGRVGAALVSANVDKVFFTGSERTGRSIASVCAPRFVPVSLELGGSDAAVVLEDADFANAASGILWGRFANAGQTCVAVKRVIAVGHAYDRLVPLLTEGLARLVIDTRTDDLSRTIDIGPLISDAQRDLIVAQLADAEALGAQVLARVEASPEANAAAGPAHARLAPAVIVGNATPGMRVWHEETFGPVLVVARAESEAEAVALANSTRYGLSASVWTTNINAGRRIAAQLQTGATCLNDSVINAGLPEVAHGGVKASGLGRIHGVEGLMECVRTRTVIEDALPRARQPWWFGYSPASAERTDDYIRLAHGHRWRDRLAGLPGTLKLLLRPERPI